MGSSQPLTEAADFSDIHQRCQLAQKLTLARLLIEGSHEGSKTTSMEQVDARAKWHGLARWLAWIGVHFAMATAVVVVFADWTELVDQTTMPAACEAYLEGSVSTAIYSEWSFALQCWDAANFMQFLALALLAVSLVLFPFTFIALSNKAISR